MVNIAELLKDCPQGMELDCTMYENVTLDSVSTARDYPIRIVTKNGFATKLTQYGQNVGIEEGKCVIFPKGKTTWEGFVPPCKFKVGDRIRRIGVTFAHTIKMVEKDVYVFDDLRRIPISVQDEYELVPNKFDINNLKPFDKVLYRMRDNDTWHAGFYDINKDGKHFVIGSAIVSQCIPYKGNEHLLGKTDDCNDFYNTWKL